MNSHKPKEDKMNQYSFKQKGMSEAIGFLEEINMLANVGGWEMDLEKGELFWTAGTKRIQDVPDDFEPEFNKALLFYKEGESRNRLQQLVKRAIKAGTPFDEEFQIVTALGREIWVRSIGRPEMVNSRCTRIFGSVQDITETKLLMLKNDELTKLYDVVVQLSGKLIQSEVENMQASILNALATLGELTGADRAVIFEVNDQDNLLNCTYEWFSEETTSKKQDFQNVDFRIFPLWKKQIQQKQFILYSSNEETKAEFSREQRTLERINIKSFVALPMFFGGSMIGFACFMSQKLKKSWDDQTVSLLKIAADIIAGSISRMSYENSLIKARQEAEAENLAKSEFLLNMGHEIKTRLHEILGFSELVQTSTKEEKSRQQLQIVEQSGKALLSLFGDLLELSKIELSQETHQEPTNLKDLLDEIKQVFLPITEKQHLVVYNFIPGGLPMFMLDQRRLKHALINLIGNAVKFTARGNITISVSASNVGKMPDLYNLTISIKDTGTGIGETMKNQIINFFDRPGAVFTKQGGNVGLGLYILKRLIGIMQGTIELESELGKGSKFTIRLNSVETAVKKPQSEDEVSQARDVSFKGQKILMVEDMIQHYLIAQTFLEHTNLQLYHATSGEEGIAMARKIKPDLILMDIKMPPGMDGYTATAMLKKTHETRNIPVIAYTTNIQDTEMGRNRHLFADLLEKVSITKLKLIDCLGKFLDHKSEFVSDQEQDKEPEQAEPEDFTFLSEIAESYSNRINKLIDIFDITEIENLIEDLENQNVQIKSPRLKQYILKLNDAKENFDFDELNHLFRTFKQSLTNQDYV